MKKSSLKHGWWKQALAIGATTACAVSLGSAAAVALPAKADSFPDAMPSWAKTANDQGQTAGDVTVEGEIYLPLRDKAGAEALATAVSTPGNPQYKHWLSPTAWINRFSPTKQDAATVINHLKSQGLTISSVPQSRLYVVFRGTASQVSAAFNTQLHNYSFHGETLSGPNSAPKLPQSVAALVQGVSIDQGRLNTKPNNISAGDFSDPSAQSKSFSARSPQASSTTPAPCSNYYKQYVDTMPTAYGQTQFSTYACGYTPKQIQSAYGVGSAQSLFAGAGQTVAIIDAYASPTMLKDVNQYSKDYGLPQMDKKSYREIVPKPSEFVDQEACQYPSGWQGEQSLDVDAVHTAAPRANILYVGGFNCGGGLDVAMSKILDGKLANIVSNSYGNVGEALPQDVIDGTVNIHLQAAGEGIGLYFSSGDNGDQSANLGYPSPDFPASSPWVTSVGGTSLEVDKKGKYLFETGWGNALDKVLTNADGSQSYVAPLPGNIQAGGAGGGTSAVFDQPAYQKGVVPDALANGHRVSPDVSSLADPYTGMMVGTSPIIDDSTLATGAYETGSVGGTSLAAPLVAGQAAVAQQFGGGALGFANPALYKLSKLVPGVFTDVKPSSAQNALSYTSALGNRYLVTFDQDTSLKTTTGYDDVTGLGSVNYKMAALIWLVSH
ncbi:subtilase family serine protease [Psychromicrobium silvestre]|uniref:Subtilase family serine protease n=1 Tax=Psychromicrobium silvestre TaxID=1645614 RepID=A0A7Y9LV40_9MICC|nr:S53 family peptidase [Psychromicrobium silvestre]NYE96175.1 subtilase family serine protease [Psychromicrobium silvestre]